MLKPSSNSSLPIAWITWAGLLYSRTFIKILGTFLKNMEQWTNIHINKKTFQIKPFSTFKWSMWSKWKKLFEISKAFRKDFYWTFAWSMRTESTTNFQIWKAFGSRFWLQFFVIHVNKVNKTHLNLKSFWNWNLNSFLCDQCEQTEKNPSKYLKL